VLVLTRKIGERIYIGDTIVLTVTAVDRGKVRLGIEAPTSVPVLRGELMRTPQRHPLPVDKHPDPPSLPAGGG
jgi:carbon storage regulator